MNPVLGQAATTMTKKSCDPKNTHDSCTCCVRLPLARGIGVAWIVLVGGGVGCRRPVECNQTAKSLGRGSTGLDPSLRLPRRRFCLAVRVEIHWVCSSPSVAWTQDTPSEEQRYSLLLLFSYAVGSRDSCSQKGKPSVETFYFTACCLPTSSIAFSQKPRLTVSASVGIPFVLEPFVATA